MTSYWISSEPSSSPYKASESFAATQTASGTSRREMGSKKSDGQGWTKEVFSLCGFGQMPMKSIVGEGKEGAGSEQTSTTEKTPDERISEKTGLQFICNINAFLLLAIWLFVYAYFR